MKTKFEMFARIGACSAFGMLVVLVLVFSGLGIGGNNQRVEWVAFLTSSFVVGLSGYVLLSFSEKLSGSRLMEGEEDGLRLVSEASEDAFWMATVNPDNFDRKLVYANAIFEELWGRTFTVIQKEGCVYNKWVHEDDYEWVGQALGGFLKGECECDIEFRIRRPDREIRWLWTKAQRQVDADGRICKVTGITRDVTEKKKKEFQLEEAKKEAESANAAKDRFLAIVSHELRTPLNPIIGYSDILLSRLKDPRNRKFLATISKSARSMLRLITDVLNYTMIESGKAELVEQPFQLSDLVSLIEQQLEPSVGESGNVLLVRMECPDCTLMGDDHVIRQVVVNLSMNALKFTEKGTVSVTCRRVNEVGTYEPKFVFEIKDTGIGIPSDQLSRIFEPFEQVGSVDQAETKGVGLGLAICRQLTDTMRGDLSVASELGKGSTFTLSLPFREVLKNETVDISAIEHSGNVFGKPYKVLVVEDDESNRSFLRDILVESGCDVTTVENGSKSVDVLNADLYDVVLMDIGMPEMNGFEATAIIRSSNGPNRNVPIIGVSAHAAKRVKSDCLASGMNAFLEKPISADTFNETLSKCFGERV